MNKYKICYGWQRYRESRTFTFNVLIAFNFYLIALFFPCLFIHKLLMAKIFVFLKHLNWDCKRIFALMCYISKYLLAQLHMDFISLLKKDIALNDFHLFSNDISPFL